MFTWTHALAAGPLGRRMSDDDDILVPVACVSGAIIPDLSLIGQILCNWAHGRRGEEVAYPVSELLTQITHSIPLWVVGGAILLILCDRARRNREVKLNRLRAFLVGALVAHITVDAFTHKGMPMLPADYLWPWHFQLGSILGIWAYRLTPTFIPRWPEVVIDVGLILLIVWTEVLSGAFVHLKNYRRTA